MAKQKARPDRSNFLSSLTNSIRQRNKPAEDERLGLLAVELGLAGGEVLQQDFGFTPEQVADWMDKMLNRAKVNRVRTYAQMAVKQIDDAR